jgi:transposase
LAGAYSAVLGRMPAFGAKGESVERHRRLLLLVVGVAQTGGLSEVIKTLSRMAMNFLACDREQTFLMPPDPRDWLPEDHLAWFVLASVEEMDLGAFYGSYRQDGWGRAAFEPRMMVALLMYAYARGERSSRGIERRCVEDVAYRVIAAQQTPDHATIARFRVRHESALAHLFSEVLGLCRESGLVKVGLIAIDGTKVHANASHHSNLDYEQLAKEILKEAGEVDAAEDELYGEARGDELPEHLRTREGRRAALRAAKEKLARERAGREDTKGEAAEAQGVELVLDPEVIVARTQGREGWLREARHQLDEHRRLAADPIPRSRPERLLECERRLQENLRVEREANDAYEHHRATAVMRDGRRFGARPNPYVAPELPPGKINVTDLDSRNVKTPRSYTQGYNVQAVVNEHQIVVAAEVTLSSPDFGQLEPMISATHRELEQIGVSDTPGVALADSGYWHEQQIDEVVNMGTQVLIPPDAGKRDTPRRGWNGGRYAFMRNVLAGELGGGLYRKRKAMVEPVFAQTKHNRRINQFQRRGRSAARSEWRLITATHNLMKLHKHHLAAQAA